MTNFRFKKILKSDDQTLFDPRQSAGSQDIHNFTAKHENPRWILSSSTLIAGKYNSQEELSDKRFWNPPQVLKNVLDYCQDHILIPGSESVPGSKKIYGLISLSAFAYSASAKDLTIQIF